MCLFALDPWWNDLYAAGGFWIGAISFVVGVIGFAIAIVQLREARRAAVESKNAAVAAREAAEQTLSETKEAFERFVAAHAGRLLSELQAAVVEAEWKIAELRANDLAELLATLPATGNSTTDGILTESVLGLREFGHTFTELLGKKTEKLPPKIMKEKWKPLLLSLHTRLDQLRAPFRGNYHGEGRPDDPAGKTPFHRPESSGADGERPSELGSEADPRGGA